MVTRLFFGGVGVTLILTWQYHFSFFLGGGLEPTTHKCLAQPCFAVHKKTAWYGMVWYGMAFHYIQIRYIYIYIYIYIYVYI